MIEDGLMERFGIDEVYGMHNMPGLAPGHFALRPGAIMASSDTFDIEITGARRPRRQAARGHRSRSSSPRRSSRPCRRSSRAMSTRIRHAVLSVTADRGRRRLQRHRPDLPHEGNVPRARGRRARPPRSAASSRWRNARRGRSAPRAKARYSRGYPVTRQPRRRDRPSAPPSAREVAGAAKSTPTRLR